MISGVCMYVDDWNESPCSCCSYQAYDGEVYCDAPSGHCEYGSPCNLCACDNCADHPSHSEG